MKQHLVVQHTYSEFLGIIEKQLEDRDIGFAYHRRRPRRRAGPGGGRAHRVLVMVNGSVSLPAGMEPIVRDDDGRRIAFRPHELAYGMLFRPEIKPGMLEDMIMEEGRPLPENIGALLEEPRACWSDMQATTDRVVAALVRGLDLMQERRKPPVFALNPVRG